jgi:hypothetical protein
MPFNKQTPRNFFVLPIEIEDIEAVECCSLCNEPKPLTAHFEQLTSMNVELCAECIEVVKDAELNIN